MFEVPDVPDEVLAALPDAARQRLAAVAPAPFGARELRADALSQIAGTPFVARMLATRFQRETVLEAFAAMPLPAPVAAQLAAQRALYPDAYEHAVQSGLVAGALWLAVEPSATRYDVGMLVAAGVLQTSPCSPPTPRCTTRLSRPWATRRERSCSPIRRPAHGCSSRTTSIRASWCARSPSTTNGSTAAATRAAWTARRSAPGVACCRSPRSSARCSTTSMPAWAGGSDRWPTPAPTRRSSAGSPRQRPTPGCAPSWC